MRATISYSTERVRPVVVRVLDLDQRRVHVSVPWDETVPATLAAVRDLLDDDEYEAVRAVLDPGGAA
jgi:hypothetical protein